MYNASNAGADPSEQSEKKTNKFNIEEKLYEFFKDKLIEYLKGELEELKSIFDEQFYLVTKKIIRSNSNRFLNLEKIK